MKDIQSSNSQNSFEKLKVFNLNELASEISKTQSEGSKVGLIGGCFDILHMGHIDLFRFAKRHVDCLCIVLDNDKTISASKGINRPLFNENMRADQIAELQSVDMVAIWDEFMPSGSEKTDQIWRDLLYNSRPDFHITNIDADDYWNKKRQLCETLGIEFLGYRRNRISSSTELMEEMMEHFTQKAF